MSMRYGGAKDLARMVGEEYTRRWNAGQRAGDGGDWGQFVQGGQAAERAARRKYRYGEGLLPPELQ